MSAATKLTCGVGTRPSSLNISIKKEGDLSIILGDSATELREDQDEEQKQIEPQESASPTFTTKIKNVVKWFGMVSLVKVHHGGIWNKDGIMYYTSCFNTALSMAITFFLLVFSSNDFAQFGNKATV